MRTRTEKLVVPEESYTKVFFGCDHCDFETDEEDQLKNHHAKTHAVKKEREVGGVKFLWFDSKEDAELFLDPPGDFGGHIDYTHVNWSEPGWYAHETEMGRGRCRCGGCEYFEATLTPLATVIERWRSEITDHEKKVEARLGDIEAAQQM